MKGHFKNILCVLGSTQGQQPLIEQAKHVAETHQAKLTFQLALDSLPPNAGLVMASFAYIESEQSLLANANKWLHETVTSLEISEQPQTLVTVGKPFYDVIQQVQSGQHDLVIAQARSGISGFLFGADAMHLVRKCPCPVWLVHEAQSRNYKTVMAAVDVNYHFSHDENTMRRQLNEDVLKSAAEVALLENASLHVVHIYEALPEHMVRDGLMRVNRELMDSALADIKHERGQALEQLVASLHNDFDKKSLAYLKPQTHLVEGNPSAAICRTVEQLKADVVVMGTVARTGIPGILMGNTAEDTIQNLDCTLLALKPQNFKSIVPESHN